MPFKRLLVIAAVLALVGAGFVGVTRLMEEEGIAWSVVGHGPAQLVAPQLKE